MAPTLPLARTASAQFLNITIDDQQKGDAGVSLITYLGSWDNSGFDALEMKRGDPILNGFEGSVLGTWKRSVFNRTNQAQTQPPRAVLKFFGTAVYVSCFLADFDKFGGPTNMDMFFSLDSVPRGNFTRPALKTKPAQPLTVFQQEDLPLGPHEIEIQNGANSSGPFSYNVVLLDAITFTGISGLASTVIVESPSTTAVDGGGGGPLIMTSDPTSVASTTSPPSAPVSKTVNTMVMGVSISAAALIGIMVGLYLWRRRAWRLSQEALVFDAFTPSAEPHASTERAIQSSSQTVLASRPLSHQSSATMSPVLVGAPSHRTTIESQLSSVSTLPSYHSYPSRPPSLSFSLNYTEGGLLP